MNYRSAVQMASRMDGRDCSIGLEDIPGPCHGQRQCRLRGRRRHRRRSSPRGFSSPESRYPRGKEEEERVLISEVLVQDKDGQELENSEILATARQALKSCKSNYALTTKEVEANQELRGLVCNSANVLPTKVIEDAFRNEYGKVVNIQRLNTVLDTLNGWYRDRGYFAQVTDLEIMPDGILKVQFAEAVGNNINIRFLDRKT
ncbi:hypothetical protein SELMODRAFT_407097 [Selaginella moellendorffii]|uniref:Uncharacterized protein n=1 Tax=Selaginella moellendorffii TaxID=88036 RepID=D8R3W8_SELML|nr:hypothetical protein SELMODRAFT_407097 [Selaginella moellendorffii]